MKTIVFTWVLISLGDWYGWLAAYRWAMMGVKKENESMSTNMSCDHPNSCKYSIYCQIRYHLLEWVSSNTCHWNAEYSTEQTIHHHYNNPWWFHNWHQARWPMIPGATVHGASPRSGLCCLPTYINWTWMLHTLQEGWVFHYIWLQLIWDWGTLSGSGPIQEWDQFGTSIKSLKSSGYSLTYSSLLNLRNHLSCSLLKACFFSCLTQYV